MKRFLLIGAFLMTGCTMGQSSHALAIKNITLKNAAGATSFNVEVARTSLEQERGLMGRTSMSPGIMGMLFVFDTAQERSFWMKNTLMPLDILFFAANGTFVSWQRMDPCKADPCPSYYSNGSAQYALEVPAGFMDPTHVVKYSLKLPIQQ